MGERVRAAFVRDLRVDRHFLSSFLDLIGIGLWDRDSESGSPVERVAPD